MTVDIAAFCFFPNCAGAGKSSIVSALLRLRPIQSGFIMVQGDDASTLNLRELRGRFGVVPQSPVLFGGSIRENLDPWSRASDQQLATTLQVGLSRWAQCVSIVDVAFSSGFCSFGVG
jgi:ATP-binding cassette subfamily C (CFTR/MRP) protein 10